MRRQNIFFVAHRQKQSMMRTQCFFVFAHPEYRKEKTFTELEPSVFYRMRLCC